MNAQAIKEAVVAVTKKWQKQRKAEERELSRASRRRNAWKSRDETTIKQAAEEIMAEAYAKAAGSTGVANARQIMYAARGYILQQTGKTKLDDQYFTQTLLPDYITEHPEETAGWKVAFDDRGHFAEPHTGLKIGLGTLAVGRYLEQVSNGREGGGLVQFKSLSLQFPTVGPLRRYGAILFIEKEGFMPIFEYVGLAERYDLAIMSTKGMSVTASRKLIDELCSDTDHPVPLLVLHDFDKSGFSIVGTLQRDTRRYEFANKVKVVDLGLRLQDVNDLVLIPKSW